MKAVIGISICGGLLAMAALCGCGKAPPKASLDGQGLAAVACVRCHTVPQPSQLAPEEWPYLLAWMGVYLGYEPDVEINPLIVQRELIPPQPVVAGEEFAAIRRYFLEQSRAQFQKVEALAKAPVSTLFEPSSVAVTTPIVSLVAIEPADLSLIIGSSRPAGLVVSANGIETAIPVHSEPVSYERNGPLGRVALSGHIGTDFREGSIVDFDPRGGRQRNVVTNHPRIAAHRSAEVDGDGREDLLVVGFGGNPRGRVGIWWNDEGKWSEQVLSEEMGAVWGDIADLDGDGDRDLVIAFGNARPRIVVYVNEGKRRLTPRNVIERPVGWGYNRCALADWDGDGDLDLIECSGNNLELRGRPVKAHHGARVALNEGGWKFRDAVFERLDGAMDVAAGDFNGDGRMDLAVVAFYPDWRQALPATALLLLQKADGGVERFGIEDRFWNRWMRVGAGDADGDGDIDVILGAAEVPMGIPSEAMDRYQQLLQGKAPVLLLRNKRVP